MLVNSYNMLLDAKKNKYAVPQFNINNLEWTKYILEQVNALNKPVILGVSEGAAKYMGGYKVVFNMVSAMIECLGITVDVCLHLDHGTSFESCKKAIDSGFTSVMIDASKYEIEENIKITKQVVNYAKKHNVTVEAEIGHIGGTEDNINSNNMNATLEDCLELYKHTGINSLAPALGSVHGLYKGEPNLDFFTMQQINESMDIPLVLHGGTGIPDYDICKAISCGISKININTELQLAWHHKVKEFVLNNDNIYDPRKVIGSGETAIKEVVQNKINIFFNTMGNL